jgi:hypothetical protein
VGQLFLSLASRWKYSKEKAENSLTPAGVLEWDITELQQYNLNAGCLKKKSCISQDWRYIPLVFLVQGQRNIHRLHPA